MNNFMPIVLDTYMKCKSSLINVSKVQQGDIRNLNSPVSRRK